MNPAQLLTHFDRISDAPDAIPRLRQFILDLAVRGKLVEQDQRDEPASELLKRIQTEKERLVNAGGARKKAVSSQLAEEPPFCVPESWYWSRLADVGFINPRNTAADNLSASFVPMTLISADYGVASKHEVKPWAEIKSGYTHIAEGDVALAKITPCFENAKSTIFRGLTGGIGAGTTELHVLRPLKVSANYVLIFLKCAYFLEAGIPKMTGTAGQKRVPTEYFAYAPFPLPPLAEQHRIVAKVDELMALCDRLEAAQVETESRRDRLVASSLHRLNNGANADAFRNHALFYFNHLPRLTTKSEHIQQLCQTILNLAVRGKLVPQDRNDRHVRIMDGKEIALSKEYDGQVFNESLSALNAPSGWGVEPLIKVVAAIVDCPHSTPKWADKGRICVRTNQFRPCYLDLSDSRYVSEETYVDRIQRLEPSYNDILYSREGGILGVACRIPPGVKLCLGQRMMLIRAGEATTPQFLEMVLNSPFITTIARTRTTGGAAPRVNVATIKAYPIPLPPLAEQHRIVAKVDELMALCDKLDAQLTTTHTDSRRLLEAVLQEALTPTLNEPYDRESANPFS